MSGRDDRGANHMTVAALAGRRVDAANAPISRFPPGNVSLVRRRIRDELVRLDVEVLVCSAACGADLVALEEAGGLGLQRRVILPSEPAAFRRTSVTDRPGDWGPLFDRIIEEVQDQGDLLTFTSNGNEEAGYTEVNTRILDEAQEIGRRRNVRVVVLVVWDRRSRGPDDLTQAFAGDADRRGLPVCDISTLDAGPDG